MADDLFNIVAKGKSDYKQAAARLHKVASNTMKKAIRKELVQATKPLRYAIRNEARDRLPKKGGLNKWAAKVPSVKTRFSGVHTGVNVVMKRTGADMSALERGRARHPVFARKNRKRTWVTQDVNGGFFADTIRKDEPRLVREVNEGIIRAVESTVTRGT